LSEWEKELARIDKQIAATSDEELAARAAATAAAPPGTMPPSAAHGGASPIQPTQAAAPAAPPSSIGATLRLGLSVALAAGMMFWPYEARCGMGLAADGGAVTVGAGGGSWCAIWSWRQRAGRSQVRSLRVRVPERRRAVFADEWPTIVERAFLAGRIEMGSDGKPRVKREAEAPAED
jgi:hypothetical protein